MNYVIGDLQDIKMPEGFSVDNVTMSETLTVATVLCFNHSTAKSNPNQFMKKQSNKYKANKILLVEL